MFTRAVEQLVHIVRGTGRAGRVAFPPLLTRGSARRKADEAAHAWLRHCAEAFGGVERVALEENLAIFMVVHLHGTEITYANLQALWSEMPVAKFVEGTGAEMHRYLRLDYDLEALGPLLKEPMPHVHVEADGEPRFPVPAPDCDIVGWFFDFVYRNFFYDHWIVWAEFAWDDWCREHDRPNQWPRLVRAFNQGAFRIIEADPDLRSDVLQLKRCLLEKRKRLFQFEVAPARVELFGHHAG
jgi:hypothetical protein